MLTVFKTFFKQHLHTQADAQQGLSCRCLLPDKDIQTGCPKFFRSILESTYAGQQKSVCFGKFCRIAADEGFLSDGLERRLEREQIAYTVIDDTDHHSTPLVEGMSLVPSKATAAFRLRATDLNAPSTM